MVSRAMVDGQYEVGLLWRNEDPALPNNRAVAKKQLDLLGKRFKQRPEFARKYCKAMSDNNAKGYARVPSNKEAAQTSPKT